MYSFLFFSYEVFHEHSFLVLAAFVQFFVLFICYVRRFPSEANKPFCFQPRIQEISVWGAMTAKGVGPLVFYDGRINSRSYINIIKPVLYAFECALSEYLVRNLIHSLISIETSIKTNK